MIDNNALLCWVIVCIVILAKPKAKFPIKDNVLFSVDNGKLHNEESKKEDI